MIHQKRQTPKEYGIKGETGKEIRINAPLIVGLIFIIGLLFQSPVVALELYENDSISVQLDSTVSWGMQFRVQDRDNDLVGPPEGSYPGVNSDDGNLNFDKGIVSNAAKITSELEISGDRWGVFARASAFYDYELMQNDRERTQLTDEAEDEVGADIDLLDANVWASHDIGDVPVTLRVGRQVVSLGESLFIGNSINTLYPIDVSKLRVPGSEIKEALKPLASAHASFGLTDNITFEGMYLFEWEEYTLDPLGTYFSTSDIAGPGAFKLMPGYGSNPDLGNASVADTPNAMPRGADDDADDQGQFALALRYYSEGLETEFSLYYINYHSQLPSLNVKTTSLAGAIAAGGGDMDTYWAETEYSMEYVEDIQLIGAAASTTLFGAAVGMEVSHRLDMPLGIDGNEVFFAQLGAISSTFAENNQIGDFNGQYDEMINGYILRDVSQVQVNFIKNLGRGWGMDTWNVLGEVGYTYVHDMPDKSDLRISAGGVRVSGNEVLGPIAHGHTGINMEGDDWFADSGSAGYRLMLTSTMNDAFWDINLTPRIAWSHDFYGNAPSSVGTFTEGRKAITLGIKADYHSKWVADLSYTNYFGNGDHNKLSDRDFIGFSIKYQF